MLKCPFAPATLLCATNVDGLSTSLLVSVPLVLKAALVSVSATVALERTAASLVPVMMTCAVVLVPSTRATLKVSL